MNLRSKKREEPEVNLTPLIDVVFLLLIFFMISTTFDRQAELSVDLPQASAEPTQAQDEVLEITVNRRGEYFIGEQQVVSPSAETLKRAINQVIGNNRDIPVIIRADGEAPYQAVVTVMDVAGQMGLVKISLATVNTGSSN